MEGAQVLIDAERERGSYWTRTSVSPGSTNWLINRAPACLTIRAAFNCAEGLRGEQHPILRLEQVPATPRGGGVEVCVGDSVVNRGSPFDV